jgi:hypothetical protein
MEEILRLIKGEVCMGTYGLVELELRKLVEGQKPSHNSAMLSCQGCKREHCSRSNPTCMACVRFDGARTDWHEQQ